MLSWLRNEIDYDDSKIPSCCAELETNCYLLSQGRNHLNCFFQWFVNSNMYSNDGVYSVLILALNFNEFVPTFDVLEDRVNINITVINLPKSRFPAFTWNEIAKTLNTIKIWKKSRSNGIIVISSENSKSKDLYCHLIQKIVNEKKNLNDVLKYLTEFDNNRKHSNNLSKVDSCTEYCRVSPTLLLPSQIQMLHQINYFVNSHSNEDHFYKTKFYINHIKLKVLYENFQLIVQESMPFLEIWLDDRTVYTTDLRRSDIKIGREKSIIHLKPLDLAKTMIEQNGYVLTWLVELKIPIEVTDDSLIQLYHEKDNFFGTDIEWIFKIQLHSIMLLDVTKEGALYFSGSKLDGFDIVLNKINTPTKCNLWVSYSLGNRVKQSVSQFLLGEN